MRRQSERGYALLFVFVISAMLAITLYMQLPRMAFESQRLREQLLVDRGHEYARGVQIYYRKFHTFPTKLDDLEEHNNYRCLRRRFVDPMTGKADWRIIHYGPGGTLADSLVEKPADPNAKDAKTGGFFGQPAAAEATADSGQPQQGGPINFATARRPSDHTPGAMPNGAPGQPGELPPGYDPTQPQPQSTAMQPVQGVPMQPAQAPGEPFPGQPSAEAPPPQMQPGQPVPGQAVPGQPVPVQPGQPGFVQPGFGQPGTIQPGQPVPTPAGAAPPGQPGQPFPPGVPQPGQPNTPANPFNPYFRQQQQPAQPGQPQLPPAFPTPPPQQPAQATRPANNPAQAGGVPGAVTQAIFGPNVQQQQRFGVGGAAGGLGAGMIAGVASKSDGEGIMRVNDHSKYKEWEFIYDMRGDTSGVGGANAVNPAQNPGNNAQPAGPGNNSRQ